ncbi:hypothetical protein ACRRTK_022910 [Alexandromys fortis]
MLISIPALETACQCDLPPTVLLLKTHKQALLEQGGILQRSPFFLNTYFQLMSRQ